MAGSRRTALTDIRERQFIFDDLHQAAAQTAADEVAQLSAVLKPLAESFAAQIEAGDAVPLFLSAVEQTRADMLLIAAGHATRAAILNRRFSGSPAPARCRSSS